MIKTVEYLNETSNRKLAKICFPNKYRKTVRSLSDCLVVLIYAEEGETCMKFIKIKFDLKSLTGEGIYSQTEQTKRSKEESWGCRYSNCC